MKTFTQPMQGLKEFEDLEAALPKLSGVTLICYRPYTLYIGTHSGTDTTYPS